MFFSYDWSVNHRKITALHDCPIIFPGFSHRPRVSFWRLWSRGAGRVRSPRLKWPICWILQGSSAGRGTVNWRWVLMVLLWCQSRWLWILSHFELVFELSHLLLGQCNDMEKWDLNGDFPWDFVGYDITITPRTMVENWFPPKKRSQTQRLRDLRDLRVSHTFLWD